MPCPERFQRQSAEFRESVLPTHLHRRVSVEAGVTDGWHKYVGSFGECVALDRFGASGPYKTVFEKFGFTADNVVAKAVESVERVRGHGAKK